MVKLMNLTPHTIHLNDGSYVEASGRIARVSSSFTTFDENGVCVSILVLMEDVKERIGARNYVAQWAHKLLATCLFFLIKNGRSAMIAWYSEIFNDFPNAPLLLDRMDQLVEVTDVIEDKTADELILKLTFYDGEKIEIREDQFYWSEAKKYRYY